MTEEKEDYYYIEAKVGQSVPDFEIDTFNPSTSKFEKFKLSENMKKDSWTILVFYPADFTFVCPTELRDFGQKYDELKKMGAELVSVSTDTQFAHLAWQTTDPMLKSIKYPMGADPTGNVSRLFGVYDEETGLAYRGTFIINPQGMLVGSEVNFNNVGRNSDELLRKVKAFKYVAAHPNEACPAKWEDGDKTLTPGEDLIGKVYDALN
jgi:peroxiredoxin (alkyl hydroperoxide reductase subunit C)